MDRRQWLKRLAGAGAGWASLAGLGTGLVGCGGGAASAGSSAGAGAGASSSGDGQDGGEGSKGNAHVVNIAVDPRAGGQALPAGLRGSNVQWTDRGDNLLLADGSVDPLMLAGVQRIAPSVLRYPGGTQSEVFHWDAAENEHVFTGAMQPTVMDTRHLLELCETLGADPLFTVNLCTGSVAEAQAWLQRTNLDRLISRNSGRPLPTVPRWELGNEPYLQNGGRPELDLGPALFAERVNAFAPALRAVDPSVRLGLPLTTDQRNGVWVTPWQGFTRQVLGALTPEAEPDFVCLHNAYMPFATDGNTDTSRFYWAAMAGPEAVADDLAAMRALLAELRPGRPLPLAITEWAPIFSIGAATDGLILSPTGALYAVDLLRMLAQQPDLELATHWSLSGNWWFGALSQSGFPRAIADALSLAGPALQGERLAVSVQCDQVATPALGQVSARSALPLCTVLPTRQGNRLRLLIVHKEFTRRAAVTLNLAGQVPLAASLTVLRSADPFSATDVAGAMQSVVTAPTPAAVMNFGLAPHSVAVLELTMAG